jgi:hypothetical protein
LEDNNYLFKSFIFNIQVKDKFTINITHTWIGVNQATGCAARPFWMAKSILIQVSIQNFYFKLIFFVFHPRALQLSWHMWFSLQFIHYYKQIFRQVPWITYTHESGLNQEEIVMIYIFTYLSSDSGYFAFLLTDAKRWRSHFF